MPQVQPSWMLGLAIALLFAGLAFAMYREHHDWPAVYHHDEPSKVEQIRDNHRNLFHPLFLLESTEWVRRLAGVERSDAIGIVATGRLVSSVCMALAIGVVAMAAYWRHSWVAAFTVGVVTLIYFRFYEVAHYFKEDTPHLLGLSLVMLCVFLHARSPSPRSIVALGAAVGFALSSKYAGAGFFAIALALLVLYPSGSLGQQLLLLASGALSVALLIHLRFLLMEDPFDTLRHSVTQEVQWMIQGHKGIGTDIPNWDYWTRLKFDLGLHGLVLMLLWFPYRHRLQKVDLVLLVYAFAYLALLTFSRKYSERYLLPASMIALFYVGLQLGNIIQSTLARQSSRPWVALATAATLMTMVLVPWLPWLVDYRQAFARDSRHELVLFLKEHLPANALIAMDQSVHLNTAQARASLPAITPLLRADYAPLLGSLDELRERGVTHLIICYDSYDRFLNNESAVHGDQAAAWQQARNFYHALKSSGEPLWQSEPRDPKPLHPGLELYAMPPKL